MGRLLLGIILGVILVPVAVLIWFRFGSVPVAVADPPFPNEKLVTSVPLQARIHREMVANPPVKADEDTFIAGAHVYADRCAVCHGFHGKPSTAGAHMFPAAPPLWEKHNTGDVVGVSDDPPGETFWKVSNGIRLTGMPSYKESLTETQMWQVSLLLANADKPLPPTVVSILLGETAPPPSSAPEEKKPAPAAAPPAAAGY